MWSDAIETKAEFEKEKGWAETTYLERRGLGGVGGAKGKQRGN